ncbi:cytidine deaminase [Rhodobacterales bacterium LSUCC0031]|nr:cytidine deaminase [Rhodobacterales bacterium LSUCC0031]
MSLIQDAARVRENAHAPYSGFKVGAAIRSVEGHVHLGCNVENVAYPEGTCAEAGAIAAMIAAGDRRIAEVAVIADCPAPVPPCGGCRQKLAEFADADVVVTLATMAGATLTTTVGALLPGAFDAGFMVNAAKGAS